MWGDNEESPRVCGEVSGMESDQLPYYGEAQRRRKDEEIERLLQESYQRALTIVRKNRRVLLRLAQVGVERRWHVGGGGEGDHLGRGCQEDHRGKTHAGLL